MSERTPAIVLGGTGYVAGELLRLIAGHPRLELAGILSDSQPGAPVAAAFPQLQNVYPELKFAGLEDIESRMRRTPNSALFCAAPHGAAARGVGQGRDDAAVDGLADGIPDELRPEGDLETDVTAVDLDDLHAEQPVEGDELLGHLADDREVHWSTLRQEPLRPQVVHETRHLCPQPARDGPLPRKADHPLACLHAGDEALRHPGSLVTRGAL